MSNLIQEITRKTGKVIEISRRYLAEGRLTFEDTLTLALFFNEYEQTNRLVEFAETRLLTEPEALAKEAKELALKADVFIRLYGSRQREFDAYNGEGIAAEWLVPFQKDLKRQQDEAHALWSEYSELNNALDLGTYWPNQQDEKQGECDQLKRWYDYAHAKVNKVFGRLEEAKREAAAVAYFRFRHLYILMVMLRDIAAAIEVETAKSARP